MPQLKASGSQLKSALSSPGAPGRLGAVHRGLGTVLCGPLAKLLIRAAACCCLVCLTSMAIDMVHILCYQHRCEAVCYATSPVSFFVFDFSGDVSFPPNKVSFGGNRHNVEPANLSVLEESGSLAGE